MRNVDLQKLPLLGSACPALGLEGQGEVSPTQVQGKELLFCHPHMNFEPGPLNPFQCQQNNKSVLKEG